MLYFVKHSDDARSEKMGVPWFDSELCVSSAWFCLTLMAILGNGGSLHFTCVQNGVQRD